MYMKKNKKHSLFFMGLVVLFLASCQEQNNPSPYLLYWKK